MCLFISIIIMSLIEVCTCIHSVTIDTVSVDSRKCWLTQDIVLTMQTVL